MATQNVVRLAECGPGYGRTVKEAINTANDRGLILMPNKSTSEKVTNGFDGRLVQTEMWENEKKIYPAWTGTLFAHGKKDAPLPKTIEYTDPKTKEKWVFDTGAAAGAKNVILAINHGFKQDKTPLIKLHEDMGRIVIEITDPKAIKILENFPVCNDFYLAENEFGIPIGEKVNDSTPTTRIYRTVEGKYVTTDSNQNARYLHRNDDEKVCLFVRNFDGNLVNFRSRTILGAGLPSYPLGALGLDSGP